MEILIRFALIATALVALAVDAAAECYNGGAESGELTFAGAVEGSGFTGRFGEFDVDYCIPGGSDPSGGRISVSVGLATADTDNDDRDRTLKGPEFFAVEQHPEARWRSTAIESDADGYRADGELTLKGLTRSQSIRFTLTPDGESLVARGAFMLAGSSEVDRQRFEIGTGEFADPEFVRNRVDVEFEVRLSGTD